MAGKRSRYTRIHGVCRACNADTFWYLNQPVCPTCGGNPYRRALWRLSMMVIIVAAWVGLFLAVLSTSGCQHLGSNWCRNYSQSAKPYYWKPLRCQHWDAARTQQCCTWRVRDRQETWCAVGCNEWQREGGASMDP